MYFNFFLTSKLCLWIFISNPLPSFEVKRAINIDLDNDTDIEASTDTEDLEEVDKDIDENLILDSNEWDINIHRISFKNFSNRLLMKEILFL